MTDRSMTYFDWDVSFSYLNLNGITEGHRDIPLSPIYWPAPHVKFYGSTANPYSRATSFAMATSHGAVLLNESQGQWIRIFGESQLDARIVIAVDWLSPDVMMKGCIDGGVRLWDLRSGGHGREPRFQHPSQINHVRRIDENTIVVAGLENQVRSFRRGWLLDLLTYQVVHLRSAVS